MNSNLQNEETIKNSIIMEYLFIIIAIVALYFISLIMISIGWELILPLIVLIIFFIAIIVNPVDTIIHCKKELKMVDSKIKKILIIFIITFPITFSILVPLIIINRN